MGKAGGNCRVGVCVCLRGVVVGAAGAVAGVAVAGVPVVGVAATGCSTIGVTTAWLDGFAAPAVAMYPTIAADDANVAIPANRRARCAG